MGTHPIFESDFDCLTEGKLSKSANMKVNGKILCCSFCLDPIPDEVKDQFILPDFQYSTQYKQLQFCSEECKAERAKICESTNLDANVYFDEYPEEKRQELV